VNPIKKPQSQDTYAAYVQAIIAYGSALNAATAANNAEAVALMTYEADRTVANAMALATAQQTATNANAALTTAWLALLNARQAYQGN
jgi:hypothetical protein